jgi:hypothetical protein
MRDLTLRRIEVIRAAMMTAAGFPGASAPGSSRLVRRTEGAPGMRLSERKHGLFSPAPEAARASGRLHEAHRTTAGMERHRLTADRIMMSAF